MKKALLFEKKGNKKVRCLACSHKCLISEGKTGICAVRKNVNGDLFLLVYNKLISEAVDPIEKKPLFHFLPKTKTYSIATVGCNFRCGFCQNYEISQSSKGGKVYGHETSTKKIVESALASDCKSISYTYNEPIIYMEFIKEIASLAKQKGLKNILVTNGYFTKESFDFISDYVDAMNIDLKSFNDDFYKKHCGAFLTPVLETIKRAFKKGIHIEITTLLIPKENGSEEELEKIAKFISSLSKNIPWHISRFFPMYKMTEKPPTSLDLLKKAEKIGKKYLKYVYLGNV